MSKIRKNVEGVLIMWKLSYPIWEDFRVVIGISIAISIILFALLRIFTNKFQCSNWIILLPSILSLIGIIISLTIMLLAEGKNGVLQHAFLGVLTYSICVLIANTILTIITLLSKHSMLK